jgi:hypothetical protein
MENVVSVLNPPQKVSEKFLGCTLAAFPARWLSFDPFDAHRVQAKLNW